MTDERDPENFSPARVPAEEIPEEAAEEVDATEDEDLGDEGGIEA